MVALAIDIGQTGARVRVIDSGDDREVQLPGHDYGSVLLDGIADIVDASVRELGADRVDAVAVGSTALYGRVPPIDDLAARLHRTHGTARLVVADDALTAFLGALGDASGVVVAAGTGLVALASGAHGTVRVDGVGNMIGDEGSGWWIGRQGLIAAFSAADGRPTASGALLERMQTRFGPAADFPSALAASRSPVAVVASFARDVADVARAGDAVARDIWRRAGEHIADAIAAGAVRAGVEQPARWSLVGRLGAADDLLSEGLQTRLAALLPESRPVDARGGPLDGVGMLLSLDAERYAPLARVCAQD